VLRNVRKREQAMTRAEQQHMQRYGSDMQPVAAAEKASTAGAGAGEAATAEKGDKPAADKTKRKTTVNKK